MKPLDNIFLLAVVFLAFYPANTDKSNENDGWIFCFDSTIDSWFWSFAGTAEYFESSGVLTDKRLENREELRKISL